MDLEIKEVVDDVETKKKIKVAAIKLEFNVKSKQTKIESGEVETTLKMQPEAAL